MTEDNIMKYDEFERTTQNLRWLTIIVALCTVPWWMPQSVYLYTLAGVSSLYCLSLYLPAVKRMDIMRSPLAILIADGTFALSFIFLVATLNSPYSGILLFIIITAAYVYRLKGALIVAGLELSALVVITLIEPFPPIEIDTGRIVAVSIFVFVAIGYQVSRLTHRDGVERETLRKLQQRGEQERSRLIALVDSLSAAIFVADSKGRLIQWNEAARIMTGTSKNLRQIPFAEALPVFKSTDPKMTVLDVLHDNETSVQHRRDLSVMVNDRQVDLDVSVTPVSVSGAAAEYIIVCEDISQEHTLEQERTEFISVAAHELRTPLAIMEAALESALATDKELNSQTRQLLEQAHRNSLQLAQIVKDLAILSESQNDNIPVRFEKIDAAHVLHQCALDFEPQTKEKGMQLQRFVADDTPVILSTEHHIMEILQNFLTNALKYSEKGAITLRAERAKNDGILFSVQDEGVGISPNDQKMLFTKFFRAENYLTRSTGGTGLGLYLCMELAERIGAKLWAKSVPGEGSTFYLEVPPQSNLKRDEGEVVKAQVASLIDSL